MEERGSAAVEFAILLPLLVALLSGIISAGLGYSNTLGLSDGVNEGARYGATAVSGGGWGSSVQQKVVGFAGLGSVTSSMVCAQLVRAPSTVVQSSSCALGKAPPGTPSGLTAGTCVVKVWAQMPVTLSFILIPSATVQVTRQSVSLYERGSC